MSKVKDLINMCEMGAYADSNLSQKECKDILKRLKPSLDKYAKRYELTGSFRRGKRSGIGDCDLIVTDANMDELLEAVSEEFDLVKVARKGGKVMSLVVEYNDRNIQLEFVNVPDDAFGAALIHSTGSSDFNQGLRGYAKKKGYLLNQYGLHERDTRKLVASKHEKDIFSELGLKYIPPTERDQNFWRLVDQYKKG